MHKTLPKKNRNAPQPLVSVVVITYNSAKTVIETLDSIKNQTYQNIELIITDDCSTDRTLEIVKSWLVVNFYRFARTELVTTERNTGVGGNNNRGVASAQGEWIKMVAGDDCFVPECIEKFVKYVSNHKESVRICVSDVEIFNNKGDVPQNLIDIYNHFLELEKEPYELQRRRVMTQLVFVGPGYFFTKELFNNIGGFSTQYKNAEEWPFIYKIIMGGNRIYVLDEKLVRYRFSTTSLSHAKDDKGLPNKGMFMGMYRHYFDHAFGDLIRDGRPFTAWHFALSYWGIRIQYHIDNPYLRKAVGMGMIALSPLAYIWKLKKMT